MRRITDTADATAPGTRRGANDAMVLAVLGAANGPLSAYDILARLRPARPRIAPVTVYRALGHLMRAGAVLRIASLNAYMTADPGRRGPVMLAICDACGRVQQRDAAPEMARITELLAQDGFCAAHPMVEVHGRCGDCVAAQ
ncbi:MAG: Fur family transcriptional regulator [Gemmobacter sp.]|uniref:Fur family transcriptional regulator n=1 Tax=Gemmobacter sp. TaxID=1898957 RepID=UPI0039187ED5